MSRRNGYLAAWRRPVPVGTDRFLRPWWLFAAGWDLAGAGCFVFDRWPLALGLLAVGVYMLTPQRMRETSC